MVMAEAADHGWPAPQGSTGSVHHRRLRREVLEADPLGPTVGLIAFPVSVDENEIVVQCELEFEEKTRAAMIARWRRYLPRS